MKKKDYFVPKMFFRLLIPSVISSCGLALADMADALAVGHTVGETGLAAISLCLPVFMLINVFMDGLAAGGSIRFSQLLGEGSNEKAVSCFNRICVSTFAAGLLIAAGVNLFAPHCLALLGTVPSDGELYTACEIYLRIIAAGAPLLMLNIVFASFLRNDNNAALATKGFLIGNTVDISLNIMFVVFLHMGTRGAALSTVTGSAVAILLYLPGILGKKAGVLKITPVPFDIQETFHCFKTGFSTSIQNLFQLVFFLVMNRLLMGLAGESGVAVFDVVYNTSFFILYLFNGTSEAAQPLVSTFTGENSEEDCRQVLHLARQRGLLLGGAAALLLFLFAAPVSAFFGITEDLMPLAVRAIRMYCTGFLFLGLNVINEQFYQAKDCPNPAFFITLLRSFVLLIPSAFLFSRFGIAWIWLMFPVTELLTFAAFLVYMRCIPKEEVFDSERILRIMVENDSSDIERLLTESLRFCEKWNADNQQKFSVTLVTEELCMSIIRNAMQNIADSKIRVTVLALEDGGFLLNVLDNAVVFNPFSLQSNKLRTDTEDWEFDVDEISMLMIKNKAKQFMYRRCSGFNSLVVRI